MSYELLPQVVFDRALYGIRLQGKPSGDAVRCLYRGPNRTACGIGLQLEDQSYDPSFEGLAVNAEGLDNRLEQRPRVQRFQEALARCGLNHESSLLIDIQEAHDESAKYAAGGAFLRQFELEMSVVARRHNLEYTP